MLIGDANDLGALVRTRRRSRGFTQEQLALAAGVSRRWLADLEGGKPRAEIGLVLRTLGALDVVLDARPAADSIDLDEIILRHSTSDD